MPRLLIIWENRISENIATREEIESCDQGNYSVDWRNINIGKMLRISCSRMENVLDNENAISILKAFFKIDHVNIEKNTGRFCLSKTGNGSNTIERAGKEYKRDYNDFEIVFHEPKNGLILGGILK